MKTLHYGTRFPDDSQTYRALHLFTYLGQTNGDIFVGSAIGEGVKVVRHVMQLNSRPRYR